MIPPLLRKGDYIYGSFVKPELTNGFINDGNPGNRDDHIGRFPFSLTNANEAIAYAAAVHEQWKNLPFRKRIEPAKEFRNQLERRTKYIAHIMTREIGLPTWEAHQELKKTMYLLDILLTAAPHRFQARSSESPGDVLTVPLGVMANLTPYSLSVQTSALFSVASILAGNTVVHKPSKYTPGVGQAIAEIWDRCKLPRGVYNMVQGPGSHIGQCLLTNTDLDGVLFAGSYATGNEIRKKLGPHFPLLLHMGGKSNALVLEDADIEAASRAILASSFRATGQRPNAIVRVIAPNSILPRLTQSLNHNCDQISIGYGEDQGVYIGPMISEHWRTRYHRYSRSLLSYGHISIREAQNMTTKHRGFYVKPAIFQINWSNGAPMLEDEPPGPILMLYGVDSEEEMISLHNRCGFRRMTSVFSDINRLNLSDLIHKLDTGTVFINQAPQELAMAATGHGKSSNGALMGVGLFDNLCRRRIVLHPKKI